jgi:A/G-specific adenine glycosylase
VRTPQARDIDRVLLAWYRKSRRDLPWRRTRDPYRIWVSEVMLQQTSVRTVIPYYERFIHRFPTVRTLARARLDRVLAVWSGLGYYRRARHLRLAARSIVRSHRGRFPRRLEEVLDLPGIGRYTAGAILSIAFDQRQPILDGNIARVLSRLHRLRGDPASAAIKRRLLSLAGELMAVTTSPGDLNQALMELGATLCTPVRPRCTSCPVRGRCGARAAGDQGRIPRARRRRQPVIVRSTVALVERDGRYLVRRRARTGLLDDMWEVPILGVDGGRGGPRLRVGERIATVRHSITFRRMRVDVRRARLLSEPRGGPYRWIRADRIGRLPASSLLGKILKSARNELV